mgnify:CR=1 FL=1
MAAGTWIDTSFVAPSLGVENWLTVYLPEGYDPQGTINYPVVYWLHAWTDHWYSQKSLHGNVQNNLISNGDIQPVIFVQPDGWCEPYEGSMWVNSELYGNYEDYISEDLIAFIDSSFHTIPQEDYRSIMGASMGGLGSMDVAIRHPEQYNAVASMAGLLDMMVELPLWIPMVLSESPQSSPPYTYDWNNGFYTNALFVSAGGYSPNLAVPDSINFILDQNGNLIDSVYVLWEQHNVAHTVKELSQPIGFSIFFGYGSNDTVEGVPEANESFADTLDDLGIDYELFVDNGGHATTVERMEAALMFCDSCMFSTGIEQEASTQEVDIQILPNPFSVSSTITFELNLPGHTRLDIYDIAGRLALTFENRILESGKHSIVFNCNNLSDGMYLIRLTTETETCTERCVLIR